MLKKHSEGGYDKGYTKCDCFWGREPGSLIKKLIDFVGDISQWEVLDAGSGEGKNTAYLLSLGANVTAIDVSSHAIHNAKTCWPEIPTHIWKAQDIRSFDISAKNFDLIVAYGLLHCLNDIDEIIDVVKKFQKSTKSLGFNVICAFNNRHQELQAHEDFNPVLLTHDQYLDMYKDWKLLISTDSDLTESHPHNNIQHTHSLTRIIAQKL